MAPVSTKVSPEHSFAPAFRLPMSLCIRNLRACAGKLCALAFFSDKAADEDAVTFQMLAAGNRVVSQYLGVGFVA